MESIMKLKKTMLAILAGTAAMVSVPALADNGRHEGRRHWDHRQHGHYNAPRAFVVVPPPRVVYAPPPRVVYAPQVVYPEPVYYAAPRYYQPAPVYAPPPVGPSISIGFRLPL
jgi:hypothetical protein